MFKPLNDRVLVKPEDKPTETSSGILLSDKTQEKPVIGEVIVGNKDVKEGDRVLFSKFGYDEVTLDGDLYYVVSDCNILGIL
jgi:chaperonin GroES